MSLTAKFEKLEGTPEPTPSVGDSTSDVEEKLTVRVPDAGDAPDARLPEVSPDVDQKLKDLEKQTEKLSKSLQKLASPNIVKGKSLQLGINIRLDSNGKLKLVETPSTIHGQRVAGRVQSYIVSLHMLQQKVREAQTKLASSEPLNDAELDQIKQIQSLKEPHKELQEKANDEWGSKEEERAEYTSIVLVSKALSRSAEKESDPATFDKTLNDKVTKLKKSENNLDAYNEDVQKEKEILEQFKAKFAELLLRNTGDPKQVEEFFRSMEFAHLRWALAQEVITIDDIAEEDIFEVKKQKEKPIKIEVETKEQRQVGIVAEAETQAIASELIGNTEASSSFRNQLKEFAEITTSHDSSAVRARTEFATEMLDRLVSRTNHQVLYDESDVDALFIELGLDTSNVPEDRLKNYESATITKAAYKAIIRQRNEQLLAQQEIRYTAVRSSLTDEQNKEVETSQEGKTKDRISRIEEIVSNDPETKKQADNALKQHFVSEILTTIGSETDVEVLLNSVEIEFQKSGYYVLVVKDRETFSKLTGSQSDNTFGAAFKHDNVFIRLVEDEGQQKVQEEANGNLLGEDDIVSEHEITHLRFDDERKTKIAREKYFHASKILNLVLKENPNQKGNSEELLTKIIEILGKPEEERDQAIKNLAIDNGLEVLSEALSEETSEFINEQSENKIKKERQSSTGKISRWFGDFDEFHPTPKEVEKRAEEKQVDIKTSETEIQEEYTNIIADKILHEIINDNSGKEIDVDAVQNRIIRILTLPKDQRDAEILALQEDDILVSLKKIASYERTLKSSSTKIARLLRNYDERLVEIDYENKQDNRYFQVEELAAELYGEFAQDATEPEESAEGVTSTKPKVLDISAIGLGSDDELIATREKENGEVEFIVHNIEAGNMLRILNLASQNIANPEQRLEYVRKWSNRIMSFEEFNQENTLLFLFELQNRQGIDIFKEEQESGLKTEEDKKTQTITPGKEPISELDRTQEDRYLLIAERYKDGAFTFMLKQMLRNGELSDFKNNEDLVDAIEKTYETYSRIVKMGFDFKELKTDKTRDVENDNFKFASRPMYDALIKIHNEKMGIVGYSYSKAYPSGVNFFMEKFFGIKHKDAAEKGIMIRRGRDEKGNKRWLFGRDATTIPVKYSSNLPFGLGEIKDSLFGIKDEGFTKDAYVKRLGVDHLDMDIAEMFNLAQRGIAERLQESKHYSTKEQVYLILDRIGLVHFHDGNIDLTYNSLTQESDQYLSQYLYLQTDRNGNVTLGGRKSKQGNEIYQRLRRDGYQGLDLHLLMEAHNNIQRMQLMDGTIHNVDAESGKKPMRIGVINMRLAERMKMMRFNYNPKDEGALQHIKEGKDFDKISRFMMDVNYDAYTNFNPATDKDYDLFTVEDLLKATIHVDNIRPNVKELGTETLEDWKNAKQNVVLTHRGKNIVVNRKLLKDYVRCFYYAKTYEAMATGIHGDETLVQMNDALDPTQPLSRTNYTTSLYEVRHGQIAVSKEEEERTISQIMSYTITDAEQYYKKVLRKRDKVTYSAKWSSLTDIQKMSYLHAYRRDAAERSHLILTPRTAAPIDIVDPATAPAGTAIDPYKIYHYKKLGKPIYFRPQGAYYQVKIDSHEGVEKSDMNTEFMDFRHHDGGTDDNAYSIGNIEGKLVNKVEDVIGEKQTVNYLYYYFRQLMVQADNYRLAASKDKERWVGIARFNMLARWLHTGLTLVALTGIAPAALGIFLNPWVIVALLGNYFILGNQLTRAGDLHSKRKVAAIKAVNELKQLEPNFEKALFNPDFSLGPERDRLFQLCKVAEDILKGALVTSVESPNNVLEEISKSLAETGKRFAKGD